MSPEVRLRMALTELGTTFIKLGQILSTRADLIGPDMAEELTKLQADVPPDDPEVVGQTVENELGRPLEALFAEFELEAMGSASIGQVHRAKLLSRETVVVKVQHTGIEPIVMNDLEILKALAELAERYDPDLRLFQPRATVADFSRNLIRELDFRRELRSMRQFKLNFADNNWLHIPASYPELSSKRVLTMEMLVGFSIAKTDKLAEENIDTNNLAQQGANMYLEMIFRDRFFHADPHPGNIWVLKILPRELFDILIRIREGRFDVSIEHRRLEKVVTWLVHGMLSAALFLGGSMILSREIRPTVGGISVIGASAAVLGLLLGYRLIRAMKRSGDL